MYHRRMQQVRRAVHERRTHRVQREMREAAGREQMQSVVHSMVR